VGLKRGPLSFASTIEELFKRKSSGSGLGSGEYARRDPSRYRVATSIRKSWHSLLQQAAVALSVQFARGLRPHSLAFYDISGLQPSARRQFPRNGCTIFYIYFVCCNRSVKSRKFVAVSTAVCYRMMHQDLNQRIQLRLTCTSNDT
jgi:hypothetical protein